MISLRCRTTPRTLGAAALGLGCALALLAGGFAALHRVRPSLVVEDLEPGWSLRVARQMPEGVSSLVADRPRGGQRVGDIYVGTGPQGGVYRFNPDSQPQAMTPVAVGMGDSIRFGECYVTALAIRDLDHDGIPELVATTSQVVPRGRPRLYVWSLHGCPVLRGMARPEIRSSWSHGLGFARSPARRTEGVVSTYCGYGEVVEYQLARGTTRSGFSYEAVTWRQVGQLPTSGEWTQTADADNDGQPDVCLATGYARGRAAIKVYTTGRPGPQWQLRHALDEQGRFGNVRFLVGDTRGDGVQDMVAWWCTDLSGGDCEIIRYRLGPEGVRQRTVLGRGDAAALWPDDNQMALADLNQDGVPEIWFTTASGNLWRYDPTRSPGLARICHVEGGLGPVAGSRAVEGIGPALYIGCHRSVLRLGAVSRSIP